MRPLNQRRRQRPVLHGLSENGGLPRFFADPGFGGLLPRGIIEGEAVPIIFSLSDDQRCASACWQTPAGTDGPNPAPSGGESGAKPILFAGCEGASGIVGMEL